MYVFMYVFTYVYKYVCTYVCMYLCMYLRMYISMYVRMYICMYVCIYVCMYVCIYVCTYVYMYVCSRSRFPAAVVTRFPAGHPYVKRRAPLIFTCRAETSSNSESPLPEMKQLSLSVARKLRCSAR